MSKSKKVIIAGTMAIMLCILLYPTKTKAALQANGGTSATKDINGWITGIRQMQATGGTLGLTDAIDGTNLTSGNKNLDIHMEKNTEYGAMVILSASSYGNPNKIEDGGTTTGNKTGVVMNINKEWVAAGISNTAAESWANASARYKNVYPTPTINGTGYGIDIISNYVEKVGDAIAMGKWHESTATTWISSKNDSHNWNIRIRWSGLLRSYGGSVFSYYGYGEDNNGSTSSESYRRDAHYIKKWSSRAAVVVGSGI